MPPVPPPFLRLRSRAAWRRWLERHHRTRTEVWIAFYRKHTGKAGLSYVEAVEEALCFGWIDGKAMRVDEATWVQRYTPRRPGSRWSDVNIARFARLRAAGLVTPAGLEKGPGPQTRRAVASWRLPDEVPPPIAQAIRRSRRAWQALLALAPSYRKQYIHWLTSAKRPETRERRIAQAIARLEKGERLV